MFTKSNFNISDLNWHS